MNPTRENIEADLRSQLVNQNINTLVASLADATIQIREKTAKIEELEKRIKELSPPEPAD